MLDRRTILTGGLSLSTLVAAGALTLAQALLLVRFRAQAMQDAVPVGKGAMAAILGMDSQAVREGCAQAAAATGEAVQAVNFNDPKQTVIAGTKIGVDKACEVLKAKGAKRALLLPVQRKRPVRVSTNGPEIMPAATYSPTHFRMQYHRRYQA